MDKSQVKKALEELRKNAKKRNFKQGIDLIINIKDLDIKKTSNHFDIFVTLPHSTGKKISVCALTGAELTTQAKETCDFTINNEEFKNYKSKKEIKKLADKYDFFIAQVNVMPEVAKTFGGVLGPRKKMPNPKAGCVVPPNANLKVLKEKLQKTIRLSLKSELSLKTKIGSQELSDDEITDNVIAVYNAAVQNLPNEKNNIKNVLLKFTMSKPVRII